MTSFLISRRTVAMASLGLALVCAATGTARATPATWYVNPAGSDAQQGTIDFPFRTIQRAVDIAAAGDTVRLYNGIYAGAGNAPVAWSDKGLVIAALKSDRDSCVVDCGGNDGFRFTDTDLTDTHVLAITGLSFVNADTAVAVLRVGNAFNALVDLKLNDCALRDGKVGVAVNGGRLAMAGCALSGNVVAGIRGGMVFSVAMADCTVRGNATGLTFVQISPTSANLIERCDFLANGKGIDYWQETGSLILRHCRVDSSTSGHGIRSGTDFEGLFLEDCSVSGNIRHGIANTQGTAVTATRCAINGNGYAGIGMRSYQVALRLDDVDLIGNAGWGIGKYVQTDDSAPLATPPALKSADKDPAHDIAITNCNVLENGAGGVFIIGMFDPMTISDSTIARNLGGGLVVGSLQGGAVCSLERVTVVANRGNGVEFCAGSWSVGQVLVVNNSGLAVHVSGSGAASLACTDLFGNAEGNWTGALLPQLGFGGNVETDPLFCDESAGDYTLRVDSPLTAAGSGGCGAIGRFDGVCPAPQGGPLSHVPGALPEETLALRPNCPNPFNPQTTVAWDLPRAGRARVAVFDIAGRRVRVLADGDLAAGRHESVWDGRDAAGQRVASGAYVARLEFAGASRTIVMGLVK